MEEQISLEEIYKMLGERDVLIYKLQREIIRLRSLIESEPKK